jgi:hypothetical protein
MTHLFNLHADAGYKSISVGSSRRDGACPFCASDRAFQILLTAKSSKCQELGFYHCWACNKKGDAITWQMEVNKLPYRAAAEACGVELEDSQQPGKPRRKRPVPGLPPLPSTSPASAAWHPQPDAWPEYVSRPEAWIEHAEKLISSCHDALLARPSALTWLAQRGVTLELIKQHRLGIHLGERVRGEDYQPSYRMASAWGMDDLGDGGKQSKIIIPAGIVIPCFTRRGELRRVNIRTMRGEPKYRVIKGSQPFTVAQTVLNPGHDAAIILETELDGLALSGLLPDITIIPMGSATGRPGAEVNKELRHKSLILLALDRDAAGVNGVDWWLEHYRQAQPWCCPTGSFWIHPSSRRDGDDHGKLWKDTGDTIKAGCDQRAWAAEGIALYAAHAPSPAKDDFLPQKKGAQLTGEGEAGKIDAAELLAFCILWPDYSAKLLTADAVKNDQDAVKICELLSTNGGQSELLLGATEGRLRDSVQHVLRQGGGAWQWLDDPQPFLARLFPVQSALPDAPPAVLRLGELLHKRGAVLVKRDWLCSPDFGAARGAWTESEREEFAALLQDEDVVGYFDQLPDGKYTGEELAGGGK